MFLTSNLVTPDRYSLSGSLIGTVESILDSLISSKGEPIIWISKLVAVQSAIVIFLSEGLFCISMLVRFVQPEIKTSSNPAQEEMLMLCRFCLSVMVTPVNLLHLSYFIEFSLLHPVKSTLDSFV